MNFRINAQNGVPVYEQIVQQVKFAVADGVVTAGDLLPSVRELARQIAINPNTVARAYRDLQSQGVVETLPGVGLTVRSGIRRDCQTVRRHLIQQRIADVFREAAQSGLDADAIRKLVEAELVKLPPSTG